uniref:Uncharacterized protein n=1 Tax=Myoviridae sp. ctdyF5 TaxID=2825144 RepID=A0A8S5U7N9_9CAUD|nr:MAG TPA: hypothetical protein [Myoviridae sp. ctdyF5]
MGARDLIPPTQMRIDIIRKQMIALEIISIRYQSSVKSSFNERRRALVALCGQALELCPDYPQYPHLRLALREEPPHVFGQFATVCSREPQYVQRV